MLVAGLRSAQVVLLGLCAYLLYATVVPLLSAAPSLRDVRLVEPPADLPERASLDELSVIWKRNAFGKRQVAFAGPPKPLPAAAKVATAKQFGWQLMTTAAGTPPELSVAGLVSKKDGKRMTIRVGDELDGRIVVEIDRRRVVLNHGGKLEQLEMASDGKSAPKVARKTASRSSGARRAARKPRTRLRRPAAEPQRA
ncbi:MAG: hypothetical protein JRG76_17155, partial [Deltaproteobacteria bacterium]|nr:hypothetical protein [Deltaproteobacteria bacterium]